jgi:hypothetical protein
MMPFRPEWCRVVTSQKVLNLYTIDDLNQTMDVDSEMKREDDDGRKERRSERDKRDKDRDSRRDRSRQF